MINANLLRIEVYYKKVYFSIASKHESVEKIFYDERKTFVFNIVS